MLRPRQPALFFLALLAGGAGQRPRDHVELLFASDYFPNQITAASGEIWYGLFPHGSTWELATTRIHVDPVTSGCIENGRRVTVDRSDHPLLLLRGLPSLRPGPIKTASVAHVRLMPGETRDFRMGDGTFRLVAKGGGPGQEVRNYEHLGSGRSTSLLPLVLGNLLRRSLSLLPSIADTEERESRAQRVPPNKRLKLAAPGCGRNCVCAPTSSVVVSSIVLPTGVGAAA